MAIHFKSQMTDAKSAISTLCQHLNLLFNVNIIPEYFRLGKYDKTEDKVVAVFWNLLSKFSKEIKTTNIIRNTKLMLLQLDYNCVQFYSLPDSMNNGSRELLIALSFLIGKGLLTEKVRNEIENSPFHESYKFDKNVDVSYADFTYENLQDEKDLLNAKKWIEGKMKLNRKINSDYEQQINKLSSKMKSNFSYIKENLTTAELLALTNQLYGRQFLNETERVITILKNHESFLKKEHIFWEWMNSVLLEREKCPGEFNSTELELFMKLAGPFLQ